MKSGDWKQEMEKQASFRKIEETYHFLIGTGFLRGKAASATFSEEPAIAFMPEKCCRADNYDKYTECSRMLLD